MKHERMMLEDMVYTWPVGVVGGIAGFFYTAIVASPQNPQDMRYVLGGLFVGSALGFCTDIYAFLREGYLR